MKVRNVSGTTGKLCARCRSWLEHWFARTGSTRSLCAALGCGSSADVGAHVVNAHGLARKRHQIAPLCYSHNRANEAFHLKSGVRLVPAASCG